MTQGLGDFAALECDLLAALKHEGARLLEELLNDPALTCQNSQPQADEEEYGQRAKVVLTALGWLTLRRSYFYSAARQTGRLPLDAALGLVDSYSPGVARWMCRAGTLAGSYEAASQDLLIYAGLDIDARQIQRMIAQTAPRMTQWRGAPAPGCKPDQPDQRPERDYGSTTYIADIICASEFGTLLRAEALRRGIAKAKTVVFLGDGAVWIWKLARINFPKAICILDYYHACEHLTLLASALYGEGSTLAKKRYRQWRKALLKDKIAQIIAQAKTDLPTRAEPRKLAKKQIAYFERNRSRMLYQTFRQAGYFIGSGVVEAGCKTVVGQRLKLSGMLWSRKGACHLLTVRCALLSGW